MRELFVAGIGHHVCSQWCIEILIPIFAVLLLHSSVSTFKLHWGIDHMHDIVQGGPMYPAKKIMFVLCNTEAFLNVLTNFGIAPLLEN